MALKPQSSSVAFWAHVGGFLTGVIIAIAVYQYTSREALIIPVVTSKLADLDPCFPQFWIPPVISIDKIIEVGRVPFM
jgi:hypothetical protein